MAIPLYRELFEVSANESLKAQMLASMARSQVKNNDYDKAALIYRKILEEYRFSIGPSNVPLAVIAGLQIVNCYNELEDYENALRTSLALYRNICDMTWNLTEAQFKTYCSLVDEAMIEIISEKQKEFLESEYSKELDRLKVLYEGRIGHWQAMRAIEQEIIPELKNKQIRSPDQASSPLFYAKSIGESPYLIASVLLLGAESPDFLGLVGAKADHEYLTNNILKELIENQQFSEDTKIIISDLSGRPILGDRYESTESVTITEYFDDYFPPWKIEFYPGKTSRLGGIDIKKSFYFWTIVVLLIVLTFGSILIIRTIAHEMDVLKIKSDFVSSVSHEFKTPLTSIRTLIERLQDGKVQD
jgi:tetratricopeptide (TPR) repeat protein